jgi:hypothetical protein
MLAGTSKIVITPRLGALLADYMEVSERVHDDLHARALVLDDGAACVALCSVELLWLGVGMVAAITARVTAQTGIPADHIVIACTHTHSGPLPHHNAWDTPLPDLIAAAIIGAWERREPARIGVGFGQLVGYSINRRWLDRPVDPAVGVLRVDRADGTPLAILTHFGCHAVIMGVGSRAVSGDFPGIASRLLESQPGVTPSSGTPSVTALFMQGGAGDVNPLTEAVRQRLAAGHPVDTIGHLSRYYAPHHAARDAQHAEPADLWNIEDRIDGTFVEVETLARALNAEALRVWRRIETREHAPIWALRTQVARADAGETLPQEALLPHYAAIVPEDITGGSPLPVSLVAVGDVLLLTQPGEPFSETAVAFRKLAQALGWRLPLLVGYANGTFGYLPPGNAFAEGGYEVGWARQLGISPTLQARIAAWAESVLGTRRSAGD